MLKQKNNWLIEGADKSIDSLEFTLNIYTSDIFRDNVLLDLDNKNEEMMEWKKEARRKGLIKERLRNMSAEELVDFIGRWK